MVIGKMDENSGTNLEKFNKNGLCRANENGLGSIFESGSINL